MLKIKLNSAFISISISLKSDLILDSTAENFENIKIIHLIYFFKYLPKKKIKTGAKRLTATLSGCSSAAPFYEK